MSVTAIETGDGRGFLARVSEDGLLQTDVEAVQRIVEPVTTRPQIMEVATSSPAVGTTSDQILAARTGRRWLEVQNLGDFPVHIRLADSGNAATAQHRRLGTHEVFAIQNGVSYEGAVQAIAIGGASQVVVQEFHAT